MTSEEIIDHVRRLADPILSDAGIELVQVEYRRESRGWVLRLYVDREGGITLEDCARISQEIGRNLDVEDFIMTHYNLEVSSPGLTRSLKSEKDFMKYRDRLVKVTTTQPIGNRRQFKGRLRGVLDNQVQVEMGGEEVVQIPLSDIAKAHLEIEF